MSKKYKIPEELGDIWEEADAYDGIAVDAINSIVFGYRRAIKAKKKSKKLLYEFWRKAQELYPELELKGLSYNQYERYVTVKERQVQK